MKKKIIEKTSLYIYELVNETLEKKLNCSKQSINLMRIDYAWGSDGNLKVLELNTAGQQGWILIKESEKRFTKKLTLSPNPDFLPKYLIDNKKCKVITLEKNILCILKKISEYKPTGIYWRGNH